MRGSGVGFGVDGHAFDAELTAGAYDAHGNFAAVRNQKTADHKKLVSEPRSTTEDTEEYVVVPTDSMKPFASPGTPSTPLALRLTRAARQSGATYTPPLPPVASRLEE